ncbi:MAG: glycosyl transferase [Ignavibacteriae bacterium]|nr:MAG: glycosyl transferase [Ignavibacteriota bacterium]
MTERVCAVVVTYNRLELLKECIAALRQQTHKLDEIIVVNNNSSDGTKEWLDTQNDITKIHQENLGGAGGFHNGMKAAYEKSYDWVWLMDDDGLPTDKALEILLNSEKDCLVKNSLVVSKEDNKNLTFGIYIKSKKKILREVKEVKGNSIEKYASFFNGTLIHQKIMSKIGFPNPLFFIYGDEHEYFFRIKKYNFDILTIVNSHFLHPPQKYKTFGYGFFFYHFKFFNKLGIKYIPRNYFLIWILYKEFHFKNLLKIFIFDLIGILFIQHKPLYFIKYILSIFDGILLINKVKDD